MKDLLRSYATIPNSWINAVAVSWPATNRLVIHLSLRRGRRGAVLQQWNVEARGLHDFHIVDVNGGGLSLTGGSHPAVRQYVDKHEALHFKGRCVNTDAIIGELWIAHTKAVDDWIRVDRYLPSGRQMAKLFSRNHGRLCSGPRFLVKRYEEVLRRNNVSTTRKPIKTSTSHRPRLLHFGASFVIAEQFQATLSESAAQ